MEKKPFRVTSGLLCISDPCYLEPSLVVKSKNGTWYATVATSTLDSWGKRVTRLRAWHEAFRRQQQPWLFTSTVCVDSGQMSIVDKLKYHPDDDAWYQSVCNLTLYTEKNFGTFDGGVASSSGLGDGMYDTYCKTDDDGHVVAAKVIFVKHSKG